MLYVRTRSLKVENVATKSHDAGQIPHIPVTILLVTDFL